MDYYLIGCIKDYLIGYIIDFLID